MAQKNSINFLNVCKKGFELFTKKGGLFKHLKNNPHALRTLQQHKEKREATNQFYAICVNDVNMNQM